MGGPFRAIVGGADQNMSFAPAQAIQLDNYSDQYGHLLLSDVFVAPGQIGMVVLVNGIASEKFRFEAPPGAVVSAPTAGQICLVRTYDEVAPGSPTPPLQPGVGVLLPIGVDQPPHHHPHTHGSHSHSHNHTSATHLHGHSGTHLHGIPHTHTIPNHSHTITVVGQAGSNPLNYDGVGGFVYTAAGGSFGTDSSGGGGNTGGSSAANSGSTAPGNTDNATPGVTGTDATGTVPASDSTNPDVHHTHP